MTLSRASLLFFSFSFFTALGGCAVDASTDSPSADGSEDELSSSASSFGYFIVTHRDARKCASPMCGGFFVKRVNQATTTCADGSQQVECYVSAITLNGIGLSAHEADDFRTALESGHALVKARTYKSTSNGVTLGTLKASEGWIGATGSSPDGTFYRTADNGIRCVKAPCPSTTAYELNGSDNHNVIEVRLTGTATPADPATLDRAAAALATTDGILVAGGIALPKCKPDTSCGPFATASEFYLRVKRTEGKACGARTRVECGAGQFCNWRAADICGAADASGTCAYRPELCTDLYEPVCGCDGNTYPNACNANAAGTSVSKSGACAND